MRCKSIVSHHTNPLAYWHDCWSIMMLSEGQGHICPRSQKQKFCCERIRSTFWCFVSSIMIIKIEQIHVCVKMFMYYQILSIAYFTGFYNTLFGYHDKMFTRRSLWYQKIEWTCRRSTVLQEHHWELES